MADNIIRLTEAKEEQSLLVLFSNRVTSTRGLSVSFDFYTYGGTGGDGFSFILLDAAKGLPSQAGGFGGSLGYANLGKEPGIKGGYIGVGFDEFGNYSNPEPGDIRTGGPGFVENAIAVRGSEESNYDYLVGTDSLPFDLAAGKNATQEEAKRTALIQISPDGLLSISVDVNQNGSFTDTDEQIITDFDVVAANGALPEKFFLGFAGSTGAETNIHEVGNLDVRNFFNKSLPGDFTRFLSVGTDGDDVLTGTVNDDTMDGLAGNDKISGKEGDDILIAGTGNDKLFGGDDDDVMISVIGKDKLKGGKGGDTFVLSGKKAKTALRASVFASSGRDRFADYNQREGDRLQLDFDNDYTTSGKSERPGSLYNAGTVEAKGLDKALKAVYEDVNPGSKKLNPLKDGQAAFFQYGKKWFLTINDNRSGFSAKNDSVVDMGRLAQTDFASAGDFSAGKLNVTDYFV